MNPFGKPLGGGSALDQLLRPFLPGIGDQASVLNTQNPHDGHVDATLYEKRSDGQIYPMDKSHLNPGTLTDKR